MKIIYESIDGADYPWIEEEIRETLSWASNYEFGPEFWSRLHNDLADLTVRFADELSICQKPIHGFKAMVTNSAITVYPQV